MTRWSSILIFLVVSATAYAAPTHDFGCVASTGEDVESRAYTRALGPIVEWWDGPDGTWRRAVRPFFLREMDVRGRDMLDILWPVGTISHWQGKTTWRFVTAFGYDYDSSDPTSAYRVWVLPFLFWGRNAAGGNYEAFFPFGGRIDGFLGRDITFVLFPLYSHSRFKDLETYNALWPLIARTTGDDFYQFRVFPFYGRSVKRGQWDKRFTLWPFWNSMRCEHPGSRGGGYVLFPFYGHVKLEHQETWMVLPPFFRRSVSRNGTEGHYPWPFIQVASGSSDKLYVWPLFGTKKDAMTQRTFWLWPFVWRRHEQLGASEFNNFRLFPLVYAEASRPTNHLARVTDRYVSVWPVVSYIRTGDDYKRVRLLDLWPFRDTAGIERDLSPWWTLYRYDRTSRGRENEVLWGLARWGETTKGGRDGSIFPLSTWGYDVVANSHREWAFLKGLVGYRRDETGRTYRLLYAIHWRTAP